MKLLKRTLVTFFVRISGPIWRATADRSVSCCLTTSALSAWLSQLTGVKALVFNACSVFRTFYIVLTFTPLN